MREIILNFPKQFKKGALLAKDVKINSSETGGFKNIVICGLGGSALPANVLMTYIPNIEIPVYSHRSYGLPPQATEKSLIVCISYSGNTEETLSAYQEAIDKKLKVVAITTGGKLQELAQANNLPIVIIPKDAPQPRFSLGYQCASLLTILGNSKIITDQSKQLSKLTNDLKPEKFEKQGKELAKKLKDKIPVIYSSARLRTIARIWKIGFNENSKIMAFFNYFPELNHNEMVGLTNLKGNFHFLIIKDKDDHPNNLKRMDLFADLAKEKGAEVDIIEMQGSSVLEKIFNTLSLGDWTTYYLALEYGQDPIPVKIVEEFKKRLIQ